MLSIHEEIILTVLPLLDKVSAAEEDAEFDYTVMDLIVDMNRACCAMAFFNKNGLATLQKELKAKRRCK